ncbi:diaminopimelate decarboxylase [Halorhodospira abdelmalekii]|uniref:diaminopimelate decarboxylase n=1 Tax=Halorhodospira abdelmalekii TaxID=421629 RepID=UPI001907D218|nr:diaminopimelate decarboxylase [Halorhodospira abdelmalekii]MBK1733724.1 diaminopimelate decarboxylase [Halorhodospira abdelmalekii]
MSASIGYRRDDEGELWIESVPLRDIAQRFGTPCYVYSRHAIEVRWDAYREALRGRGSLCYAVKANGTLAILSLLAQRGAGFDIVSGGELARVLRAGGDPARIVFSGVGKTVKEIRRALLAGIRCFNVESAAELERIEGIAAESANPAPIALRINPDIDPQTHPYIATGLAQSKFGIALDEAEALYQHAAASPHLTVEGVAFHIGSQLLSVAPLREAAERTAALVRTLHERGITMGHVDVGGGLGVRYVDEEPPDPQNHIAAVAAPLSDLGVELLVEPGRAIVAEAGALLTRVEYLKQSAGRDLVIVDAGMNDYLRPALYDAAHRIEPLITRDDEPIRDREVVGPICESSDLFARHCPLAVAPGDVLAIRCTGAYGAAMASQYNGRPRAPEVLVDGAQAHLIRRRETIDDLMRGESVLVGG